MTPRQWLMPVLVLALHDGSLKRSKKVVDFYNKGGIPNKKFGC